MDIYTVWTSTEARPLKYMKYDAMKCMLYKFISTGLKYGYCDYRSQCLQISQKKPTVSI